MGEDLSGGVDGSTLGTEQRFRALVQNCSEVIIVCDRGGVASYVSPACQRVFGRPPEALVGASGLLHLHPDDLEVARRDLAPGFAEPRGRGEASFRVSHVDGSWRWVAAVATNLLDDPDVGGVVLNLRDVDSYVRATEALQVSEQRMDAVLRHSRDVIVLIDSTGRISWVSPAVDEMLGHAPGDLVGTPMLDHVDPDDAEAAFERVARTLQGELPADPVTVRLHHRDGHDVSVEVAGTLLEAAEGPAESVILNLRDVGWRIDAERALRASEERFRALVQESSDAVVVMDERGTIEWASPAFEHLFGVDPESLVGTTGSDLTHPDDLDRLIEELAPVFDQPGARAVVLARMHSERDGWRWVEHTCTNLRDDPRVAAMVLHLHDVTDELSARQDLAESEQRFRLLAQSSPIGIFQHDVGVGCVYVNERWQEITGLSAEQAAGQGWRRAVHPEDARRLGLEGITAAVSPEPVTSQVRVVRPDGEVRWVTARAVPLFDADGVLRSNVGTLEDVTDHIAALRDSERMTDIFEATHDIVGIADRHGRVLSMNRAARRYFDLPATGPLEDMTLTDVFDSELLDYVGEHVQPILLSDGMWSGELTVKGSDGESRQMLAQLLVHTDDDGRFEFFSGVMHDISERKRFESELAHQATHDPLTGLPNRTLLLDRLGVALDRSRRLGRKVAVLFLDLDRFKVVNDSLGHELGDRLLVAIADRLQVAVRPRDLVARFGGDEFVVLCEDLVGRADTIAIAERLEQAVSGTFTIDEHEVFIGVSIGIAFPADDGVDPADLIRDADAAMYRAKERGRARWEVFDQAMRERVVDRLELESALRRAVERRELRLHYQPVFDLADGSICGVEALVRWEHPERGLLAPSDFIAVAEETGLIVPLGGWVLRQGVSQLQRWDASLASAGSLWLSVNLSGRQLAHPTLVSELAEILAASHLDPARIRLEMTESVLMDDVEASEETLGALKALGVGLAVDDFGTGYSSLSYLRRFPVDVLKVDRSFVDGLGTDPSDSAIVAAIVTLAHTLGLTAVAEGVETAVHVEELRRLGCDHGQGFHLARPAPADDVSVLLEHPPVW